MVDSAGDPGLSILPTWQGHRYATAWTTGGWTKRLVGFLTHSDPIHAGYRVMTVNMGYLPLGFWEAYHFVITTLGLVICKCIAFFFSES
jgi:hypothetical protein